MCVFGVVFSVVPLSRFRRLCGVGVALSVLALHWFSGMVSDGLSGLWIPEKERAESLGRSDLD